MIDALFRVVIGGGFLYVGIYLWNSYRRIEANGIKTKAKIVEIKTKYSRQKDRHGRSRDRLSRFPIVQFTDRNGIETSQRLNYGVGKNKLNSFIDIVYLKKGKEYEIISISKLWKIYVPMIFIIVGLFLFGFGLVSLVKIFE